MKARLRFHGATHEVTGSMHILEANGYTLALDCGLYQGRRAETKEKNLSFPCPPSDIDAVILSHAHIDHCGRLPRLVAGGFEGRIYTTPPTRDLVELLLADSAHIQEEDAAYWNKKRVRRGDDPIEPLYTQTDVEQTLPMLESYRLGETFEPFPGLRVQFFEAGHMLGSSGIYIEFENGGETTRLVYTGDRGRPNMAILRDPAPLPECDFLITESTYGARSTYNPEDMEEQLGILINAAIERGGKIIIPSFAVGRTQVVVYHYHRLLRANKITKHIPVIVDSPLAVRATEVFEKHPEVFDKEATRFNHVTGNIFDCDGCRYILNVNESKALNEQNEPMIIISASGMCEAGRILHHLKNNLEDPKNTVLIVGYQAMHTLGRRLIDKVPQVRIFGEEYTVQAKVKALNGFSSHANAQELAEMTAPLASQVRQAFIVHGELEQSQALAEAMRTQGYRDIHIPENGDVFDLN